MHSGTHFLQLEDPIQEGLRCRRASGDIDIHGHDTIAPPHDAVAIVVVSTAVRAAAHRDDPSRVRHLVVHLAKSRSHLVRECPGHDHHVGLARGRSEDYTEAILVVARG